MTPIDDEIDEAAMAEAEAALLALADEYPAYASADVDQMEACLAALRACGGVDGAQVAEIYGVAHNIKGQGSAFGYELMTLLGDAICMATRNRERLDGDALASLGGLVAACRTVLAERLIGDGGAQGARLSAIFSLPRKAA